MMRPRTLLLILLVAGALVMPAARPSAQGAPPTPFEGVAAPRLASHVLVKPAAGSTTAGLPGRLEHIFGAWYRLYPPPGETADSLLTALAGSPAVERVEPDYVARPDAVSASDIAPPNDPLYPRQWHMPQVQLEQAWASTTGIDADTGVGVRLAVLDSGIATTGADGFCHPLAAEYNAFDPDSTALHPAADDHNHGTHVAGTAAGCARNGKGVVGVAYDAGLMAVKVLDRSGNGSASTVAAGIVWAADNGARVINLSLGIACRANYPACSSAIIDDAIAYAAARDVVVVASAGNSTSNFAGIPANHPDVIAVSATRYDHARASYSNYGLAIDLAAPGGQTAMDQNGDGFTDGVLQETFNRFTGAWSYYSYQGTSMAAPHVAGAAALLRACVPEAGRDAVRAALETWALDLGAPGFDTSYGHGFLQIHDALAGLAYANGRDPAAACAPTSEPPPCFTLSLAADGPGTITVEPPPNCDPTGGDPVVPTAYTFGTTLTLTATPDDGRIFVGWGGDLSGTTTPQTLRATRDLSVTAIFAAPPLEPRVIVSLSSDGTAAGLAYADEDALLDDPDTGLARLFDGSEHGLAREDVDALALLPDGTLLLSFDSPARNLPGMAGVTIDDSDIVRFDPATELFGWYFDGSDVGLTSGGEDVDAIALLPDGRLLISTSGGVAVPGMKAADEDVLVFSGALGSDTTAGTWALYLDGSDLAKGLGDIDGLAWLPGGGAGLGALYLSAERKVTLGGQVMAPGDVFACEIATLGATSSCAAIGRYWQATAAGLPANANVDAVEMRPSGE